jgi:hypothetical protein
VTVREMLDTLRQHRANLDVAIKALEQTLDSQKAVDAVRVALAEQAGK